MISTSLKFIAFNVGHQIAQNGANIIRKYFKHLTKQEEEEEIFQRHKRSFQRRCERRSIVVSRATNRQKRPKQLILSFFRAHEYYYYYYYYMCVSFNHACIDTCESASSICPVPTVKKEKVGINQVSTTRRRGKA